MVHCVCMQSGVTSKSVSESDWLRVEYLEELAQWLYYHELPLQDCVDLLHWAVDLTLSLRIQQPSWLEVLRTDGHWRHAVLLISFLIYSVLFRLLTIA